MLKDYKQRLACEKAISLRVCVRVGWAKLVWADVSTNAVRQRWRGKTRCSLSELFPAPLSKSLKPPMIASHLHHPRKSRRLRIFPQSTSPRILLAPLDRVSGNCSRFIENTRSTNPFVPNTPPREK